MIKLTALFFGVSTGRLQEEKYKSDNSDVNDLIDDIIQEFKPKK